MTPPYSSGAEIPGLPQRPRGLPASPLVLIRAQEAELLCRPVSLLKWSAQFPGELQLPLNRMALWPPAPAAAQHHLRSNQHQLSPDTHLLPVAESVLKARAHWHICEYTQSAFSEQIPSPVPVATIGMLVSNHSAPSRAHASCIFLLGHLLAPPIAHFLSHP